MQVVLMSDKGFVAETGHPTKHTPFAKFAKRFPLNPNTVRLAAQRGLTMFTVAEPKPTRSRTVLSDLAGVAA